MCFFTLQCLIFFELSYGQNVKIRVIKRLVVKSGYKQGGKPATRTVRLGLRFGLEHVERVMKTFNFMVISKLQIFHVVTSSNRITLWLWSEEHL